MNTYIDLHNTNIDRIAHELPTQPEVASNTHKSMCVYLCVSVQYFLILSVIYIIHMAR
jgi:hypothetical protein